VAYFTGDEATSNALEKKFTTNNYFKIIKQVKEIE
jgi:hypothetical protein